MTTVLIAGAGELRPLAYRRTSASSSGSGRT
jgi:hypothetical protein